MYILWRLRERESIRNKDTQNYIAIHIGRFIEREKRHMDVDIIGERETTRNIDPQKNIEIDKGRETEREKI
jgi:hypothetical protein